MYYVVVEIIILMMHIYILLFSKNSSQSGFHGKINRGCYPFTVEAVGDLHPLNLLIRGGSKERL